MAQMAFDAESINVSPARARRVGEVPVLPADGDASVGGELYANLCSGCHGATGRGDGSGASALSPAPSDLSAHEYAASRIAEALWNGIAGTAMPAWRDQPRDRLASLAAFVTGITSPPPSAVTSGDDIAATIARGATVFANNCVQCHGETGAGDGFSAAALPIAPTDFRRQRPSQAFAVQAIRTGISGTPMAPWTTRLTAAEIDDVATFVRSLYQGRSSVAGDRR
jgi:mono/diheme cytochrome c family protein